MKFSLRELLLVTLIAALTVGWWVERRKVAGLESEIRSLRPIAERWQVMNTTLSQLLFDLDKQLKSLQASQTAPGSLPGESEKQQALDRQPTRLAAGAREKDGGP